MRKGEQTHSCEGNVTVMKPSRVTVKYSTVAATENNSSSPQKKQPKGKKPGTPESVTGMVRHQNKFYNVFLEEFIWKTLREELGNSDWLLSNISFLLTRKF